MSYRLTLICESTDNFECFFTKKTNLWKIENCKKLHEVFKKGVCFFPQIFGEMHTFLQIEITQRIVKFSNIKNEKKNKVKSCVFFFSPIFEEMYTFLQIEITQPVVKFSSIKNEKKNKVKFRVFS